MATKFGVGDDVGDNYHCAEFYYDPIRDSPPPPRAPASTVTSLFWVPATPYGEDLCTGFHDLYVR